MNQPTHHLDQGDKFVLPMEMFLQTESCVTEKAAVIIVITVVVSEVNAQWLSMCVLDPLICE